MADPNQIARDFLSALASNDPILYEHVLHPDVGMRQWNPTDSRVDRPRARVIQHLMDEWSAWGDASLEILTIVANDTHAAIEFRVQATENARYVEHIRSAFLKLRDGQIQTIDLYCPAPLPSARRSGWIAPA